MRFLLTSLFIVGCASGTDVGDQPDAGVAQPDVAVQESAHACDVVLPDPTGTTRGHAGGTGGGKGPILACDDVINERIVGVAVRMSNQNTLFGARSAHGI